jgi:hypothetical protein
MPGFDGTGPRGMGPMTGGGRGFCSPRGLRRSFAGRGPGYGYPYTPSLSREQELSMLKGEAEDLRAALEEIDARIREVGGEG